MKLKQKLAVGFFRLRLKGLALFSASRAAEFAFRVFSTPPTRNNDPFGVVFDRAERLLITVEKLNLVVYRWNRGAGQKIMINHGFESASTNFHQYIETLINAGFEVCALDAPAHGASQGKRINLPMYTESIREADKQFGPFAGFIAHSFGGSAAMHFIETSDKYIPRKIVLIAPFTETTTGIDQFFKLLGIPATLRPAFDGLIKRLSGVSPSWFSIARIIGGTHARVLWIHDRDDLTTPLSDVQPVIDQQLSNVEFIVTKGLGHRRIYRDPEVVKKVIDFLSEK